MPLFPTKLPPTISGWLTHWQLKWYICFCTNKSDPKVDTDWFLCLFHKRIVLSLRLNRFPNLLKTGVREFIQWETSYKDAVRSKKNVKRGQGTTRDSLYPLLCNKRQYKTRQKSVRRDQLVYSHSRRGRNLFVHPRRYVVLPFVWICIKFVRNQYAIRCACWQLRAANKSSGVCCVWGALGLSKHLYRSMNVNNAKKG